MAQMKKNLFNLRQGVSPEVWKGICVEFSGDFERQLEACIFTMRARRKPRGYAGDAIMIDHIYGTTTEEPPPKKLVLERKFTSLR